MSDDVIPAKDWINYKQINRSPEKPPAPPKINREVSEIVGKEIKVNDPRLINVVNKWREYGKENQFDNHLQDPKKRQDLKNALK